MSHVELLIGRWTLIGGVQRLLIRLNAKLHAIITCTAGEHKPSPGTYAGVHPNPSAKVLRELIAEKEQTSAR